MPQCSLRDRRKGIPKQPTGSVGVAGVTGRSRLCEGFSRADVTAPYWYSHSFLFIHIHISFIHIDIDHLFPLCILDMVWLSWARMDLVLSYSNMTIRYVLNCSLQPILQWIHGVWVNVFGLLLFRIVFDFWNILEFTSTWQAHTCFKLQASTNYTDQYGVSVMWILLALKNRCRN